MRARGIGRAARAGWLRSRWSPRLVVGLAAMAGVATQAPRWSLEAPVTGHRAAPVGKALRVEVEASLEPSFYADGGGWVASWQDGAAISAWAGRGAFHFDAGQDPARVGIEDKCGAGSKSGLCSGCDPPPGAHVRVVSVTEVDVWSLVATAAVPAGAPARIEVEVDSTRPPLVVVNGTERCSAWSSSGTRSTHTCYLEGAAAITAQIRGACASGPCTAPPGETLSIVRAGRAP